MQAARRSLAAHSSPPLGPQRTSWTACPRLKALGRPVPACRASCLVGQGGACSASSVCVETCLRVWLRLCASQMDRDSVSVCQAPGAGRVILLLPMLAQCTVRIRPVDAGACDHDARNPGSSKLSQTLSCKSILQELTEEGRVVILCDRHTYRARKPREPVPAQVQCRACHHHPRDHREAWGQTCSAGLWQVSGRVSRLSAAGQLGCAEPPLPLLRQSWVSSHCCLWKLWWVPCGSVNAVLQQQSGTDSCWGLRASEQHP